MKNIILFFVLLTGTGHLFAQWTSNTNQVFLDATNANKNVGIGTSTNVAQMKLIVKGGNFFLNDYATGSTVGNFFLGGNTTGGQNGIRLSFSNPTVNRNAYFDVRTQGGSANDGLLFRVDGTIGGTERMRIRADNGYVGIGTGSLGVAGPAFRLHVYSGAQVDLPIVNFGDSDGRRMFFVPKLGAIGFNPLSKANDLGIFWSDNTTFNNTAGFVLAPHKNANTGIRVAADGKINLAGYNATVGTGLGKVGLGYAYGNTMAYGTSYIGFNAVRTYTGGANGETWLFDNDGANNGGSVIWGDVSGKIRFAALASTGATNQTPNDGTVLGASKMAIGSDGKVLIGPDNTAINSQNFYRLYVKDGILTEKLIVALHANWPWADYVFDEKYALRPLEEVEAYVKQEKHLPNIPSTAEVISSGLDVAEMNTKLLEKVEELTLYLIQQQKEIKANRAEIELLKLKVDQAEK